MFKGEDPPLPPGTIEENPREPLPPGAIENLEGNETLRDKVLLAGSIGLLWLTWNKTFGELGEKDQKSVEKRGWLRTALGKALETYKVIGKIENQDYEGAVDTIMGDKNWRKAGKGEPKLAT